MIAPSDLALSFLFHFWNTVWGWLSIGLMLIVIVGFVIPAFVAWLMTFKPF